VFDAKCIYIYIYILYIKDTHYIYVEYCWLLDVHASRVVNKSWKTMDRTRQARIYIR
jgi:hypothetical protein